jgi:hypothetical protein
MRPPIAHALIDAPRVMCNHAGPPMMGFQPGMSGGMGMGAGMHGYPRMQGFPPGPPMGMGPGPGFVAGMRASAGIVGRPGGSAA